MDGQRGWANRVLLKRAGISRDFLKKLSEGERSYYGAGKDFDPNGFVVDAGMDKIMPLLPKPTDERLLAAARAALRYNYSLGITAWLDPLADEDVLKAYRLLADRGELLPQGAAFPQVFAKTPVAELAPGEKAPKASKNVPHLLLSGQKEFADGIVEFACRKASLK